jgi:hypothetical protein
MWTKRSSYRRGWRIRFESVAGPFLPVGDRQLSKVQRPVSRFAPELTASECRVVVISARCPAGDDPFETSLRVLTGSNDP